MVEFELDPMAIPCDVFPAMTLRSEALNESSEPSVPIRIFEESEI